MSFETNLLPERLYRVGRSPNGLFLAAWDLLRRQERGRWDDTGEEYRVLYCSDSIVGCFVEILGDLRQNTDARSALDEVDGEPDADDDSFAIVRSRLQSRWTTTFIPGTPSDRIANVVAPQSRTYLEQKLPGLLADLEIGRLKIGDFISHDRILSRHVSRVAYDDQHIGVVAPSAEGEESKTYAFFEARPVSMQFRVSLIIQSTALALQFVSETRAAASYLGLMPSNITVEDSAE